MFSAPFCVLRRRCFVGVLATVSPCAVYASTCLAFPRTSPIGVNRVATFIDEDDFAQALGRRYVPAFNVNTNVRVRCGKGATSPVWWTEYLGRDDCVAIQTLMFSDPIRSNSPARVLERALKMPGCARIKASHHHC